MPDGDVLRRTLGSRWRRSYGLLRDGAPLHEVVGGLQYAAAQDIRESGGLPQLTKFSSIYAEASAGTIGPIQAIRRIRDVVRQSGASRNAWIAKQAVEGLVGGLSGGSRPAISPAQAVAEAFVRELVETQLFARVTPQLIGVRFDTFNDAATVRDSVQELLRPGIERLSQQLVRDPSGARIHARRNPRPQRRPTAELLNEPVEV